MDSQARSGPSPRQHPHQRHVKVRVDANPYDLANETYFEEREEIHMRKSFRGSRILRFLWDETSGSGVDQRDREPATIGIYELKGQMD